MKFSIRTFFSCFKVIGKQSKRIFKFYVFFQVLLAVLDLIGITIIGIVASLSINRVSNRSDSPIVTNILTVIGIDSQALEIQVSILVVTAILLMVSKSVLAQRVNRRVLSSLNSDGTTLSANMLKWIFLDTSRSTQGIPNQELLSRVASGAIAVTNGVIGSVANILSDLLLLLLLLVGLFIVSPLVTGVAVVFFGITAWILHKLVHTKSRKFGFQIFELTHSSSTKIIELFSSKRELWTSGRFDSKLDKVVEERKMLASKNLELSLLPNISKYFIESALLIGAAIFAGIEFFLSSATHALTALSVFLAAGSRIAPALLRLQQSGLVFASNVELADKSLADIASFQQARLDPVLKDAMHIHREDERVDFIPSVELKDLSFDYGENKSVFESLNLTVQPGEFVGIIGPSGSGKSTILDLIIGIQVPTQGEVRLSGMVPEDAIKRFSGFISYVPQQTFITQGTVAENIAFGIESSSRNDGQLWEAITGANLEEWVMSLPKGLDEVLYENGKNLSGGQRQRIGIARALYSDPKLILLDESTSSLDADSELEVLNWIKSLKGKKTIISVTHKLSTVRDADKVLYLEADNYIFGTFEEIMELKHQVK